MNCKRRTGRLPALKLLQGIFICTVLSSCTNSMSEFFNDSAQVKNTLTARNARWYEQEGNILIRDSVVIINDKGERLDTEELVWNKSIEKFFTEKPVRITTATHVIYGKGMEANQDFSLYKIFNPTGNVQVDKKEMPK